MIIRGELDRAQLKAVRKKLASLELPPAKRKRLLWRLGKYGLIPAAKRNIRNQASPDGQKWQGRQTKRKGKMLRNMPKLLHIREMPEIDGVRIYLSGGGYHNGKKGCDCRNGGICPSKRHECHDQSSPGGAKREGGKFARKP